MDYLFNGGGFSAEYIIPHYCPIFGSSPAIVGRCSIYFLGWPGDPGLGKWRMNDEKLIDIGT